MVSRGFHVKHVDLLDALRSSESKCTRLQKHQSTIPCEPPGAQQTFAPHSSCASDKVNEGSGMQPIKLRLSRKPQTKTEKQEIQAQHVWFLPKLLHSRACYNAVSREACFFNAALYNANITFNAL